MAWGGSLGALPPRERHAALLAALPRQPPKRTLTDADLVRETYRFLRSAGDDADAARQGASVAALATAYYARLHREYVIADLSAAAEGRVGMRWRTEGEVREGRGQFTCGVRGCYAPGPHADVRGSGRSRAVLRSYELHFQYREADVDKEALVKLRCCERCSARLAQARRREARRASRRSSRGEGELRETAAAPGGDADAGEGAGRGSSAGGAKASLGENLVRTNETLAIPASIPLLGSAHADARKRQRGDVCGGSTGGGRKHARTEGAEGDSSQARAAAPAGADSAPPRPQVPASAHVHRPGGVAAREAEEAAEQLLREMFE